MQCVAACCSVFLNRSHNEDKRVCVTACCSLLQCVAVQRGIYVHVLQCVMGSICGCCSVLQYAAVCCSVLQSNVGSICVCCSVLCNQFVCVAVCCGIYQRVLQCVPVCCTAPLSQDLNLVLTECVTMCSLTRTQ